MKKGKGAESFSDPRAVRPYGEGWVGMYGYTPVPDEQGRNVYEAAKDRIREVMLDLGDPSRYFVSWSGGKDSTTLLMLSIEVARELNMLPVQVLFIDEEVYDPETIKHAEEVRSWDEVQVHWLCIRMGRTGRSQTERTWIVWDEAAKDDWYRPLPPWAITMNDLGPALAEEIASRERWGKRRTRKNYFGTNPASGAFDSYEDALMFYVVKHLQIDRAVMAAGIRAEESFNRARALVISGKWKDYQGYGITYAKPIYDWRVTDVWHAIVSRNWPHSRHYDNLWALGVPLLHQRVAPWGNVASAREVKLLSAMYPNEWERAMRRVPALRAMARYGDTPLMREAMAKPAGWTWQQYTFHLLDLLDEPSRAFWLHEIDKYLVQWAQKSTIPFPDITAVVDGKITAGRSWQRWATIIGKNDKIVADGKIRSRDLV